MQFNASKKNSGPEVASSRRHAAFQDPVQMLLLLLSHWKLILASTFVAAAIALIYLYTATPIYQANARLEIYQESRLVNKQNVYERMEKQINRHILLMQSQKLRKDLIQGLKEEWTGKVDHFSLSTGFIPVKASKGSMLDIVVDGPNPAYAQAYLEGLIDQYLQIRESDLESVNNAALAGLRSEEQSVLRELEAAKIEIHKFSEENEVFLSQEREQMDAVFINQLLSRLKTIRLERTMLENQYADIVNADLATIKEALQLSRGIRTPAVSMDDSQRSQNPSGSGSSSGLILSGMAITADAGTSDALVDWEQQEETLAILQNRYDEQLAVFKETHPKMLELKSEIEALEKNLEKKAEIALRRFQARFAALKLQEKGIESVVSNWKRDEPLSIDRKNHFLLLQTKVDHLEKKYDTVYKRVLENSGRTDSLTIRTIHEPTVSLNPVSPKAPTALGAAIVVGICLSVGYILIREFFRPEPLDIDDFEHQFGTQCLVTIPNWSRVLESKDFNSLTDRFVVQKGKNAVATETYRALRYRLDSIFPEAKPFSLAVTSPKRSDGKTFNTANIAIPYSWDGKRVLLIDGDIRRSSLTHSLLGERVEKGWANWLHDPRSDIQKLITRVADSDVDLLPAGLFDDSIPELIKASVVRNLIKKLHERYDVILIDSAPSSMVVESNEICRATDGVLVMADANTSKAEMGFTLRLLKDTRLIGFCVNKVNPKKQGYGYGYGYASSYGQKDSIDTKVTAPLA